MNVECEECGKTIEGKPKAGVSLLHGSCWIRRLEREIGQAPNAKERQRRTEFLEEVRKNQH